MTPKDASAYARELCGRAPVIPVLVVEDVDHAVPLAEALVAGGLPVLEVTLRTPAALEVIRRMATVPGGIVGAGTLLTPAQVAEARAAGARFGVSPGVTDRLVAACEAEGVPAGPINDLSEVFTDPQVIARALRIDPEGIAGVRSPFRFSEADLSLDRASPKLGQNDPDIKGRGSGAPEKP